MLLCWCVLLAASCWIVRVEDVILRRKKFNDVAGQPVPSQQKEHEGTTHLLVLLLLKCGLWKDWCFHGIGSDLTRFVSISIKRYWTWQKPQHNFRSFEHTMHGCSKRIIFVHSFVISFVLWKLEHGDLHRVPQDVLPPELRRASPCFIY